MLPGDRPAEEDLCMSLSTQSSSDDDLVDDLGTLLPRSVSVTRVVSLVPSLTESVAHTSRALLVGATDWCTHPADLDVARIGGTKNPDVAAVVALRPDLVLANDEENRAPDIAELRAAGVRVWVTAPRTVAAALTSLERMLAACRLGPPRWLVAARRAWQPPYVDLHVRAFVPIWRRPWMSLGSETFAGDVLACLGVAHVFADDGARYPRVDLEEVRRRGPGVIVLPDEPYAFTVDEGHEVFGDWGVPVVHVSGRDLTWYGPSLVDARDRLAAALTGAAGQL
jgi:ABC-type Fe3+-hydroxamate transport system substrate-binding protein